MKNERNLLVKGGMGSEDQRSSERTNNAISLGILVLLGVTYSLYSFQSYVGQTPRQDL